MGIKTILASVAVVAAAATGGYWYYSPILSMQTMRSAAEARDAETFNRHVDYPKLRESFKGQMAAMVAEQLGNNGGSGAESLGAMLGLAMLNPMVDALVRPEVVMRAMQSGELEPKGQQGSGGPQGQQNSGHREDVQWEIERKGFNRVIAYGMEPGSTDTSKAFGVVFDRYGFSEWKLTEVRLPQDALR